MGDFEQMLNDLCKMSKAQLVQMVRNTDEVETALNIFKNLMKEDYARVLRCKDCKYVNFTEHRDYLRCTKHCAFSFRPNDFCSYGERREE
nr:MAG TPA: hypothetical protein [Caudoviricetes sp.]